MRYSHAVTRAPAPFRNERELQARLARVAKQILGIRGEARVRREMPIGSRLPDVVVVSLRAAPPPDIWPRDWSFQHASLVAELRRGGAQRRPALARRLYETDERLARFVDDLLASGCVRERRGGALSLANPILRIGASVTAFEAKLSRWNEALAQALSYRSFADRVVVAMDAGRFRASPDVLRAFRGEGVGLVLIGRKSAAVLNKGRIVRRHSSEREYVFSSALTRRSQTLWTRR